MSAPLFPDLWAPMYGSSEAIANIGARGWHIQVQVFDKSTKALAGAKVSVHGNRKITLANKVFGSPWKQFYLDTVTDQNGNCALDFSSSGFRIDFSKAGFVTEGRPFSGKKGEEGATNQDLKIFLDTEGTGATNKAR